MSDFPLPRLQPIPLDRFSPARQAEIASACVMPDGDLLIFEKDGGTVILPGDGAPLVQSMFRLIEERGREKAAA